MPALIGQTQMTLRDGNGNTVIQATISFVPETSLLRDAVVSTSTSNKTGALVVDNLTGRTVRVLVRTNGTESFSVSIPPNGLVRTVSQLSSIGITTIQDFNGLTFDLT